MKIKTKYFGELELSENEIIHFPDGIYGFEDSKSFIIIRFDNSSDCFLCLQSATDEMLAFVMINPFYAEPEYSPMLSDDELASIGATPETPLLLYAMTVIRERFSESTINLKCPIAVNPATGMARQVILDTPNYSMKHPIG